MNCFLPRSRVSRSADPVYPVLVCGLEEGLYHEGNGCADYTHSEKSRKKFCSKQRIIGGPEFGSPRQETLVVDSQFLGDFRTRDNLLESLIPFWVGGLGVEISFYLGRGEGSEDEGDDLAFDEVKVYGCRKA